MKTIAFYLPQYHRVPENDEWWGEGFTDWTAVKNATPLYEGHNQPVAPLNGNYYDLTDKSTMQWQAGLMHEYGVDALCFYHYWFKDGRMILQKPAENLLKWKDIDMPFCFSWANETWARSWSRLNKFYNTWASSYEKGKNYKENSGILLEQKYGNNDSWKEHFEYLRPFFEDERYVRVDNRPVFVIHKPSDIYCLENMIECWQELAHKAGLEELYIIGNNPRESQHSCIDKVLYGEPAMALSKTRYDSFDPRKADYAAVWDRVIKDAEQFDDGMVSGFVKYDDTPRRGEKGIIIENCSPQVFEDYLGQLMQISVDRGNELFFINAWNEWGEGMFLEPDAVDGFGYLNAVKHVSERVKRKANITIAKDTMKRNCSDSLKREMHIKLMLDQWLTLLEQGKSVSDFLTENKLFSVGIYGYGMLGKHLATELDNTDIKLSFIADRAFSDCRETTMFLSPEDPWPDVDAVIVTAVNDYGFIYSMIRNKGKGFVPISLEHILFES